MRKVWAVARKEMRQTSRDPLSLAMLLGVPAFMLLLYGYALNFDVRHVPLAVQDDDKTAQSRDLIAAFVSSTAFDLALDLPGGADLARLLEARAAAAVLVIPEGYGADVILGRAARVQLLVDGSNATTASTLLGYAEAIVAEKGAELLREQIPALAAASSAPIALAVPSIDYRPRVWYNPELKSTQFLVPGLIGFILMLTAVLSTALSVVREKERGTYEQLRVTSLSPSELILGKALPYLAISLAATAGILVVARVLFDVEVRGPLLGFFAATLLYLVGALGWGLLISSFSNTQAFAFQAGAVSSMLPAIFLSGFIFPIRNMPAVLQAITYAVPARYYLTVIRGIILKGAGLTPFGAEIGFLAIYAFVVLAIAYLRLSRQDL